MTSSTESFGVPPNLRVQAEEKAPPADVQAIMRRITEHTKAKAGGMDWRPVNVFLRQDDGAPRGALLGWTLWSCFYVDTLWVDQDLQGRGYGRQLMEAGEAVGRERGCAVAAVDTFNFQALEFYQKLGYSIFGRLPGFARGMERFYLTKVLA
jgi:ribosomal protein S18 acetylase RimI-like enzyme